MGFIKRCYRLLVQVEGQNKVFSETEIGEMGLKVDFSATNSVGSNTYCSGDITIYNLNKDDMYYLASCVRLGSGGLFKRNAVQLEVGYNGDLSVILAGNVTQVDADFSSADRVCNLKIQSSVSNNLKNNSIQLSFANNTTLQQIADKVAEVNDLQINFDSEITQKSVKNFSFVGTPLQCLNNFKKQFKEIIDVWIDNDGKTLMIAPKTPTTSGKTLILINEDGGLVGSPKPTQFGITLNTLLNPSLKAGKFCRVKSSVISQYNGTYRIIDCKHSGSTQSNAWLTTLDLRKVG